MTVRNMRRAVTELIQYITPDDIVVNLHDPPGGRAVMLYEGDGLPSLSYDTTRGPFQHGSSVLGAKEPEREINLAVRWNACDRDEYWDMRHEFGNYLRPNRTDMNNPEPGVLRRVLSNGEIYDLDVYLVEGPRYVFPSSWDHFSFQEALTFMAFNPILYKPDNVVSTLTDFDPGALPDIVFPFEFPFEFAEEDPTVSKSFVINYDGNWESYPIITVEGPWTNLLLTHTNTGKVIELTGYSSPAAEITTFDLTYDVKTILTGAGVSLMGYLVNPNDLGTFRIEPDPLVAGGINTISVTTEGGSAATEVILTYKERFITI